jgi:MFS family permease
MKLVALIRGLTARKTIPTEYRINFSHLYADVAWFGVLSGSTIAFLSVYATRLGASGSQIGLINAAPAIISLIFALPFGALIGRLNITKAVFWTAAMQRIFYILIIPFPFLILPQPQIWAIIFVTLIMSIPGTGVAVGFNTLLAEAVPPEWRARVVGTRNALLAIVTTITTLLCGQILSSQPQQSGYQMVFAIGGLGAVMSNVHLWFVRPVRIRESVANVNVAKKSRLRLEIVTGKFGKILTLLFLFHFAQYLAIPIFPVYIVNVLKFSDRVISLGTALFNVTIFLGSLQLERLTNRIGNKKITGIGITLLGIYPALLSVTHEESLYYVLSLLGGVVWSLVGGALYNYLLEKVPEDDRPSHMAWYSIFLNAAILGGSLLGPLIGAWIGLPAALILFALARGLSGAAILRWG